MREQFRGVRDGVPALHATLHVIADGVPARPRPGSPRTPTQLHRPHTTQPRADERDCIQREPAMATGHGNFLEL